jgi:phosphoglycolate phosphatase-like HAD superfamily hydrolase
MKDSASPSKKSRRQRDPAPATFAAKAERHAPTLILFDIDGTLVLTGGAGGRAMSNAFEEIFGIREAFRGVPLAGRTDAWILRDGAAVHGISPDSPALARFRNAYLKHLVVEIEKPGPRKGVMPGIRPLLDALSARDDIYLALLTGNYEEGARIKLEYFDLWRYFRCGAFGDEAPHRNGLVTKAVERVAACGGPALEAENALVIGDTPLDVAGALFSGARSLAVATGNHSVDELRAAGADVVMPDLSDTREVLRVIADLGSAGRA